MNQQYCPICTSVVETNSRYPNYVCSNCLSEGVSVNGELVKVQELDIFTKDEIPCEVKGKQCIAHEAHFGGVDVQII